MPKIDNFRKFEAGPDPFDRMWTVEFQWLQTAISIRHSDTVDVMFRVSDGESWEEKVIALRHADLLALSETSGRRLTDPWCMKLAALHLTQMIETAADIEKAVVTPSLAELEEHNRKLGAI